ncbi:M23 family metallopeptidase [Streptomyces thermocoprophilus]|jgi:murein DD-endopeptidase MepM/ murein hydrolase activator NlpD|uniref:M23 family metallopeptidase n=1 Tax=Streptomyces thermocoprophilus TaxID=78356 RepID=A0ABV5VHQ5_9ACTN
MRRVRAVLRAALVTATAFAVVMLPPPLHAPATAPPAAPDDSRPPAPGGDLFDRVLADAARRTAEHEKARARADRLRREVARLRAAAQAAEAEEAAETAETAETVEGAAGKAAEGPEAAGPGDRADAKGETSAAGGKAAGGGKAAAGGKAAGGGKAAEPRSRTGTRRVTRADVDRAVTELRAAERQRARIRDQLWRQLRKVQPGFTTAAPDGCSLGRRSGPPHPRPDHWVPPTARHRLTAGWDARGAHWRSRHTGQDFAVPKGTPVRAVGPGTVRVVSCGDAYGNQVVVRHADGYFTQYAHLSRVDVRPGQRVVAGQRLGTAGATGNATGPHLHFEVRVTPYLGSAVPPLPWLGRHGVELRAQPAKR